MFALFSAAFSTLFIAVGIAAVVGHVVLIDVLLRSPGLTAIPSPPAMTQNRLVMRPAPMIESRLATAFAR